MGAIRKLLLFSILLSALNGFTQQPEGEYALLWKISGNGLKKPSYLFGTMHLRDSRVYEFSDSVLVKLDECEAYAMEIHPDSLVGGRFSYMYYKDDLIPVDDILNDSANSAKNLLGYEEPFILNTFYARSRRFEMDKPVILDAYLFNLARRQGKKTYGIEKIEEHVNLADKASAAMKVDFRFRFDFFKDAREQPETFIDIYRSGNIRLIDSIMHSGWYDPRAMFDLLDRRNFVMAHRIDSLARMHSTFAAIGSAHLAGKNGVISLLRNRGYDVTRVPGSFTGLRDEYEPKVKDFKWYTLKLPHYGYSVDFPGAAYSGPEKKDSFRIHSYIDLGTNLVFQTWCISHGGDKRTFSDLYRKVIISTLESGEEKDDIVFRESRDIIADGQRGRVALLKNKKDSSFFSIQVVEGDGKVYVNRVRGEKGLEDHADIGRFFDSFSKIPDAPLVSRPDKEYQSRKGAFGAHFKYLPLNNKYEVYEDLNDTASYRSTEYYFFNNNFQTRDFNYVYYSDYKDINFYESDTAALEDMLVYDWSLGEMTEDTLILKNDIPGREVIYSGRSGGNKVKAWYFVRGNRKYVVVHKLDSSGNGDNFFDSFKFYPFEVSEFSTYNAEANDFTVDFPDDVNIFPDSSAYEEEILVDWLYESVDPLNGAEYQVYAGEFKPYFSTDNIEDYLNEKTEFHFNTDSVEYVRDIAIQGFPAKEIKVYTGSRSIVRTVRLAVMGDRYYYLQVRKPEELADLPLEEHFFNSFHATVNNRDFITSSKTPLLLNDLISEDEEAVSIAKNTLEEYDFKDDDLPLLLNALDKHYPDDTMKVFGTRARIFHVLKEFDTSLIRNTYSSYYGDLESPYHKLELLNSLSFIPSEENLNLYFRLLDNPPQLMPGADSKFVFELFSDSLQLVREYFPQLSECLGRKNLAVSLSAIIDEAVNNEVLFSSDIIKSQDKLLEVLKYYSFQADSGDANSLLIINRLSSVLPLLQPTEEAGHISDLVGRKGGKEAEFNAAVYRILHGKRFRKKELSELLASDADKVYPFLKKLDKAGKLAIVPDKYLMPEKLVKMAFEQHVFEQKGYLPDSTDLINILKTEIRGKDKKVFVYRFVKYGEWYWGIAGPQPPAGSHDFSNELTSVKWRYYMNDEEVNDQVQEIIENYNNELLKMGESEAGRDTEFIDEGAEE